MVLGILGGGQLGMLLTQAANKIGVDTFIYSDEKDSPAINYSQISLIQPYDNWDSINDFMESCDVVTFEFENIPFKTLNYILESKPVFPNPRINQIIQDRLLEKDFINKLNINTTDFVDLNKDSVINDTIFPAMLKTRRMGYDGKGQSVINSKDDLININYDIPYILEKKINLLKEFSIILTRYQDGKIFTYEPIENIHQNQILHTSTIPASIDSEVSKLARKQSEIIANSLNYIGTMCVEYFIDQEQKIYVNEIAPRVHNSGHLTLEAYNCSQFESHIRAVCNLEKKEPKKIKNAQMVNVIGEEINNYRNKTMLKNSFFYDYEKKTIKLGRKMGHLTKIS
jgi:5-(carboxyamino)imidazole ribonucleotide synthase